MTTVLDTLKQCHALVWQARAELEHVWPCPDVWDSLLFCQTEVGEVVDSYLRGKGGYARNRDKQLDMLDELGDLAMMALTALGSELTDDDVRYLEYQDFSPFGQSEVERLTAYSSYVADALDAAVNAPDWFVFRHPTIGLLVHIVTHPGMDLPQRLQARLEAIKAKRQADAYAQVLDEHEATLAQARVRRGSAPCLLVGEEGAR